MKIIYIYKCKGVKESENDQFTMVLSEYFFHTLISKYNLFNELVTFRIKEYKNSIHKTYENVIDMFKDMTICLIISVKFQLMYNT